MANSHTPRRANETARFAPFETRLRSYFSRNVRACREHKGLTLEQVADVAGTSITWINLVESGKKKIGFSTLTRFAVALSVDADQLLSPAYPFGKPTPIIERTRERTLRTRGKSGKQS